MKVKLCFLILLAMVTFPSSVTGQRSWSLSDCVSYAIEHNVDVKMRENDVDLKRNSVASVRSQFLPAVTADVSQQWTVGRSVSPIDNTYQTTSNSSTPIGVALNQPILAAFGVARDLAASKYGLSASVAQLQLAKMETELAVTAAYLQLIYCEDVVDVNRYQVDRDSLLKQRIEAMRSIGKATVGDVCEIQAQLSNDMTELIRSKSDLLVSKLSLLQVMGMDYDVDFRYERNVGEMADAMGDDMPSCVFEDFVSRHPSILHGSFLLSAYDEQLKRLKIGKLPKLDMVLAYYNSLYYVKGFDNRPLGEQFVNNGSFYLGFNLSVPLFDGLANRNSRKKKEIEIKGMQLQLEKTSKEVGAVVQRLMLEATAAHELYRYAQMAQKDIEVLDAKMLVRYENGKATVFELNQTRINYLKAVCNTSQAKSQYLLKLKQLEIFKKYCE